MFINHARGLAALYTGLRRPVLRHLEKDRVESQSLPPACPYTLEQILDPDWYPDNVHGIKDPVP